MNLTDKKVDGIFWAILTVLLLLAIGTIVGGVFLVQDKDRLTQKGLAISDKDGEFRTNAGALLITLGSLGILAALFAGIYHLTQTWARGNWARSIYDKVNQVPAKVRARYDERRQSLRNEKWRQRNEKIRQRCNGKRASAEEQYYCNVLNKAEAKAIQVDTPEKAAQAIQIVATPQEQQAAVKINEKNQTEAAKEADQITGPIADFSEDVSAVVQDPEEYRSLPAYLAK